MSAGKLSERIFKEAPDRETAWEIIYSGHEKTIEALEVEAKKWKKLAYEQYVEVEEWVCKDWDKAIRLAKAREMFYTNKLICKKCTKPEYACVCPVAYLKLVSCLDGKALGAK